ncbi:DUF3782 domain-containing protein [Pseudanabaena cinerea]|uniref:DUF3782 domain-containing protein n=1 Tax=Pseudanabaena cinerea TaxID=2661616 RepID=UPI001F554EE4|nr:DUF3782 domain-containing protein [Pseudanabaena cinerea]
MGESFEERQRTIDQQLEKTSQEIAKLAIQVAQTNKQVGGLTSRWGDFVENLIKPAAARLFQEKGIEVKSHLEVRDVKRFLETLERFKKAFPKRKHDRLYGAVAGIKIDERVNEYAIQEGLLLIQPAGDSVIIANSPDFKPRVW